MPDRALHGLQESWGQVLVSTQPQRVLMIGARERLFKGWGLLKSAGQANRFHLLYINTVFEGVMSFNQQVACSVRSAQALQLLQALPGRWPVWRGHQLGRAPGVVVPTGFDALDAVLPGGGWPTGELTELVGGLSLSAEHRLLAPALARHTQSSGSLVLIGPRCAPVAGAWAAAGVDERRLLWIDTHDARQTAWVLAQCLQAAQSAWLMAWLPEAPASVLRRLQVLACAATAPCVVWRPESARGQASPAPLRLQVWPQSDWALRVQVFKRRGPPVDKAVVLRAVPWALQPMVPGAGAQPLQHRGMALAEESSGGLGRVPRVPVNARNVVSLGGPDAVVGAAAV